MGTRKWHEGRAWRRRATWNLSTLGALGMALLSCGPAPAGEPGPYRLHPTFMPTQAPEASPTPRRPRRSPPPETVPPAPYPYATPSLPESEPFEAVGMILLRGEPLADVTVSVVNNQTFRNVKVKTDPHGVYRASGLAAGSYFVHYYNDRDNFKIGYWKTLVRPVGEEYGASFPAFDLYLIGMQNEPGMGDSLVLPGSFVWEPYGMALRYRFRIHDRGGPGGKPYYVSNWQSSDVRQFSYDGSINQKGMGEGKLAPGRYLWGTYWDAGQAGEGGNLYQDFVVKAGRTDEDDPSPEAEEAVTEEPPAEQPGASEELLR